MSDLGVKADLVITFHRKKLGMTKNNVYMKQIIELSIGIPIEASIFVGRGDLYSTLKKRKIDNYKGQFGRLLVIGGSKLFHASIFWSADVAAKFVDLVHFTSPANENNDLVRKKLKDGFWNGIVVDWSEVEEYIKEKQLYGEV